MKHRITLGLMALLSIFVVWHFISGDQTRIDKTGRKYAFENPQALKNYLFEQKKIRKSRPKSDRPDQAMLYEIALRSERGKPFSYSGSWRMDAQRQALRQARLYKQSATLTWQEHGPANVGGRTRAIVVHPDNPDIWWVGAVGGGVWYTENAGADWVPQTDDMPTLSVTTIGICRSRPQILYAGTGEGFYNYDAVIGDGVFKTEDGGQTWHQLLPTAGNVDFRYVNRLVVHPFHADTVLVATNSGVYRTLDGGDTWEQVFTGSGRVQQIIANPENFNSLFITVSGAGIFRSTDMGRSWTYVSEEIRDHRRVEMAIAAADTNILYASFVNASSGLKAFCRSSNSGKDWINLGSQPNWLGKQGWYDNTLMVDPLNPNRVFVGGIDLYEVNASDSSMSVRPISHWYGANDLPYVHADQHFISTVVKDGSTFALIVANDGGVFYSQDEGLTWQSRNANYNVTQYYDADRHPFRDQFIAGAQDNGTHLSPTGAVTSSGWYDVLGGDGFDCAWDKYDPNMVYGTVYDSRVYRSTDGGLHFRLASEGLPESDVFHTPLTMDPHNSKKLLTISEKDKIYITRDGAQSWQAVDADLGGSSYAKITVSQADSSIIWAASWSGNINLSVDGGKSFQKVPAWPGMPNGRVSGLATHPTDSATALALFGVATFGKIFRTHNLGQSWQDITGNLPEVPVHCAVIMPYDTSEIWIGTDIGLFISYDNGSSWQLSNSNLPSVSVRRLKIVDQQVVAATHGRGVWSVFNDRLPEQEVPLREPLLADLIPPNPNTNQLKITFTGRAEYDSVLVKLNEQTVARLNAVKLYEDTSVVVDVQPPNFYQVRVDAFGGNQVLSSEVKEMIYYEPVDSLFEPFNSGYSDFSGDFSITRESGFPDHSLSSPHPYDNKRDYFALLNSPLNIKGRTTITYKDVALVEPGEKGSVYPDFEMWDYVTVEGSRDGEHWDVLLQPYDCRFHPDWQFYYENNMEPDRFLFQDHTVALSDYYDPGTKIYLRFRLFADDYTTGWGWTIDDVYIGTNPATAINEDAPVVRAFRLMDNYPNPFNPQTTIRFSLQDKAPASLVIYNALGQKVRTLFQNRHFEAGPVHQVRWDGKNDAGQITASGLYYYRLTSGRRVAVKKMLLLR